MLVEFSITVPEVTNTSKPELRIQILKGLGSDLLDQLAITEPWL